MVHLWELLRSDTNPSSDKYCCGGHAINRVNAWTLLPRGLDWARKRWLPEDNVLFLWIWEWEFNMGQVERGDSWLNVCREHLSWNTLMAGKTHLVHINWTHTMGKACVCWEGHIYRHLNQSPRLAMSRLHRAHFLVFYEIILLVEVTSFGKNLNIIPLLWSVLLLMKMF